MKNHSQTRAELLEKLSGLLWRVAELQKSHDKGNGKKVSPAVARVDRTGLVDQKKATPGHVQGNEYPPSGESKVQEAIQETEAQLRIAFEDGTVPMATLNPDLQLVQVNRAFCDLLGYTKQELKGRIIKDISHPDDVEQSVSLTTRVFKSGLPSFQCESRFFTKSQTIIWSNVVATVVRDSEGKPTHLFVTIENITERKRAEDLQNLQRLALEKVAVGTNQSDVLNELCSQVKTMLSPCTCTVMLLDKQTGCLNVAAPADLPEGLSSALDGLVPGEFAGSWGTAVYTRKPVIVTDTETDPRWADLRDFAREFGIRACWSIPLFSTGNQIVGAFAISHPQPRDATSFDLQILETISYVAGIAIERRRSEEVLQARAHQQALVTELGQSALTGLDLPILMHVAVSLIAQTLEVEYCKVLELLPDGEEMILRAGFGYPADAVNHVTVGEGLDSQAAYTLVSEKPVVVEDLRTETRFSGTPLLHQLGVRSGMSVIISGKPHHFGVLGIHSTQLRTFTSDDIHFVQAVANVLALAIERKRMEETLRISEQAIRELYEITSAPETSFESRVRALLELGCQRFNLPIGLVTRREGDHFEMKFIRTGEMIEDFVSESRRIHICNLYCGAALEAEEPICFGHASKSDWAAHPGFYTTGLEAYLGTKIVVSGDKYGTLFFAGFEPYRGTFTEGDKDFLQLIARWIGGEIERQEAEEELKRQRSFLRQVIDSNPNFVFAKNREGRFTLVNQAVADVYGTTVEDLLGKTESDFSSDVEEVEAFQRIDLEVMDSKQERFMAEETITDAAGQIHWLQTVKRPLSNDEGVADQVLSVATDITARKQAEEALVKSELRFRLVARATYDAIWDWDVVRNSLEWNDGTQSLFGHEPDAVGPDLAWWIEHIHPEDRTRVVNKVHAVIESGASVWSSEYQFRCYDGTYAMVMDRGYVVYDETGQAIRMVGAMNDITERKQAEEALRESEEHLRFVTDHSPVGIVHCDQAQRYKFVNRHFAEMFGLQASDIVGMSARELLGEDVYAYYVSPYLKAVQAGQHLEYDLMLPATSHGKRTVHIRCVPERDASGQVAGYIASLTDITERKQAEAKLKASEERYAMVMGAVNEGIWDWEIATKQVYLSSTWKKILGYADDEVQNVYEEWTSRIHPEDYDRVMASLKKHFDWNQPYEVEYRLRHKDGTYQWILTRGACVRDEQGRPYRMFGSITDITQRKNAEDQVRHAEVQLRHSQKMNALGTLAGGIAHDFNNILAALMGYTELIHTKGPYEKTVQGYLTEVLKAGSRAKELVQQILTFSCQTEGEKKPLHLQQVVQEVLMLIRATLPSTIEIQVDLSASSDLVEADATQIHQVLMNLCTNAEYAMRDQGGVLSLRLETEEEVAADSPAPHLVLIPGPHLLLTVQDTGYGMSSEVLDRVFDPFFTTKGPGEGTGMGLAVVHGIIADHHGRITVTSTPGEGTTVSIVFPLLAAAATAATAIDTIETDAEHSSAAPLKPGNGHVLFVDDEVPLVELGKEVLEEFGYEVTTRTSSLEALEAFRAAPGRYDVLITDQTMPNLSGEALAREILRIRPDIPILLFTGFSHTITADKARELGIRKFLMKPLLRNDLLLAIQEVLDEVDTKD